MSKENEKIIVETFLGLKEKLTGVEVNVLVNEISSSKKLLDQLSEELKVLNERTLFL